MTGGFGSTQLTLTPPVLDKMSSYDAWEGEEDEPFCSIYSGAGPFLMACSVVLNGFFQRIFGMDTKRTRSSTLPYEPPPCSDPD